MRPLTRSRRLGLALLALLVVAAGPLAWLYDELYVDHVDASGSPVLVEVPAGASLREVSRRFAEAGVLSAAWKLRVVARLQGGSRQVKAGYYELRPGRSPASILEKLVAGEVSTIRVTIPEGWTVDRIATLIADSLDVSPEDFLELARTPPPRWRERLDLPAAAGLEGYLHPETYRFARGLDVSRVIDSMLEAFEAAVDDTMRARADEIGLTLHEVVTLASIVEAEARLPEERGKIAAVYHNRLAKGWRLEADPTVAYALGKSGEDLTYGDLEADSAYNTYRRAGLPPGPINNPGRESIRAALWPESGFAAMYFVADGEGGHVFSRTWEEHRAAVRRYRQSRRDRGRD